MFRTTRSKMSLLLSVITILTLVSAFMVTLISHGAASHAATTTSTTASYQGKPLKASQVATSPSLPTKVTKLAHPLTGPVDLDAQPPIQNGALKKAATVNSGGLPTTTSTADTAEGKLIHNFNGISNTANDTFIGGELTPPDQGLCVGPLPGGSQTYVLEPVNEVLGIYTTSGKLVFAESLASLFSDPFSTGDVRCFYDAQSKAFYFTEIGFDPTGTHTVDDLAVLDSHGFATYQFDSSLGGFCFGDQPHVGYENYNLYIATDEYCGPLENIYEGALLIAISKPQLLNLVASPNAVYFGPVSLGGDPIVTLQPGISGGLNTEYLLNSFPYDKFGNSNSISDTLGLWQVIGGQHVTTGGTVILAGEIIRSETYAFPQPAASTGTGTVVKTICSGSPPRCFPITSEAFLNPDDDRMMQVQVVKNGNDPTMYAAVSSAVTIDRDPTTRDGVAWFIINPAAQTIEQQGYYAVAGSYLLYPTLFHANSGTTTLVFSITSPTLNPSAAFAVMKAGASSFGSVQIAGLGADPHLSFSDAPPFNRPRWGDYTASALDPSGNNIWSAAEYIPPKAFQGAFDNWGTRVFEVAGN